MIYARVPLEKFATNGRSKPDQPLAERMPPAHPPLSHCSADSVEARCARARAYPPSSPPCEIAHVAPTEHFRARALHLRELLPVRVGVVVMRQAAIRAPDRIEPRAA